MLTDESDGPKLTVLVASFRSNYLSDTLQSLRLQSFGNFVVEVLDDANDKDTAELVAATGDPRFRYVARQQPLGPAANHWNAIVDIKTKYFAIVNHDDLVAPDAFAILLKHMEENSDVSVAFCRTRVVGPDGAFSASRTDRAWRNWCWTDVPVGKINNWLKDGNARLGVPIVASAIVRTSVAQRIRFPTSVGGSYDYWMGYRLARGAPVYHVDQPLGFWREHDRNLTHSRSVGRHLENLVVSGTALADPRVPYRLRVSSLASAARSAVAAVLQQARELRAKRETTDDN